jgi:NitT/TauT family transport system permease protein
MNKQLTATFWVVVVFAGLFGAWLAAAAWFHPGYRVDAQGAPVLDDENKPVTRGAVLLPGPWTVLREWYELFEHQDFLADVGQSVKRITLGLLAAIVPAFFLGIWFGVKPRVRSAVTPVFAFIQYIPPVAFVPILILWLGIGLPQQVALLFIGTFFYLTVMVAETVANTPPTYHDAALTLGARPYQLIWNVIVPHGMPDFIQHLRVMVGIGWTYLTAVEMVSAENGIGKVIITSQRYLQTGRVLAGLVTIGVLGIVFDLALRGTARLLCRWKY